MRVFEGKGGEGERVRGGESEKRLEYLSPGAIVVVVVDFVQCLGKVDVKFAYPVIAVPRSEPDRHAPPNVLPSRVMRGGLV